MSFLSLSFLSSCLFLSLSFLSLFFSFVLYSSIPLSNAVTSSEGTSYHVEVHAKTELGGVHDKRVALNCQRALYHLSARAVSFLIKVGYQVQTD